MSPKKTSLQWFSKYRTKLVAETRMWIASFPPFKRPNVWEQPRGRDLKSTWRRGLVLCPCFSLVPNLIFVSPFSTLLDCYQRGNIVAVWATDLMRQAPLEMTDSLEEVRPRGLEFDPALSHLFTVAPGGFSLLVGLLASPVPSWFLTNRFSVLRHIQWIVAKALNSKVLATGLHEVDWLDRPSLNHMVHVVFSLSFFLSFFHLCIENSFIHTSSGQSQTTAEHTRQQLSERECLHLDETRVEHTHVLFFIYIYHRGLECTLGLPF